MEANNKDNNQSLNKEEFEFTSDDFFSEPEQLNSSKQTIVENNVFHEPTHQETNEESVLLFAEESNPQENQQTNNNQFEFTSDDFFNDLQQIDKIEESTTNANVTEETELLFTTDESEILDFSSDSEPKEKTDNFGFKSLPKRADYDNTASFNFNLEVQEKMQSLLDGSMLDSLSAISQSEKAKHQENQSEESLFLEPESLVIDSTHTNETLEPQDNQTSVFEENNAIESVVVEQNDAQPREIESSENSSLFLAEEEVLIKAEPDSDILLFDTEDEKKTKDDLLFELPNEELNAQEVIVDSSEKNDDIDDEFDFSLPNDTEAVQTETNNTSATINEEALLFAEEVPESQDAGDDLLFELPDEKQESSLFEETVTEQVSTEQNLFEESLDEQDNAEGGSLFEEDAFVQSETQVNNDDSVLNHESTDSVQIDDIGVISSQKNQNKALARLIPYSPQRYFCLPTFATLEILEKPQVIKLPCTRNYVYGMIEWQNQHIPLIDIQRFIMNDNSPLQSDDVNFALVVVYVENQSKEVKHVAIALNKTPSSFMADDSMMTELPTDNPIWQKVAISCFEYQGSAVPIVNSNFLFGN